MPRPRRHRPAPANCSPARTPCSAPPWSPGAAQPRRDPHSLRPRRPARSCSTTSTSSQLPAAERETLRAATGRTPPPQPLRDGRTRRHRRDARQTAPRRRRAQELATPPPARPGRARRAGRRRPTTATRTGSARWRPTSSSRRSSPACSACVALIVSLVVSVRIGRGLIRDLRQLRRRPTRSSGVRLPQRDAPARRGRAGRRRDRSAAPGVRRRRDRPGRPGPQHPPARRRRGGRQTGRPALAASPRSSSTSPAAARSCCTASSTLLDTMERRTEDTDELADLFRLDHLTTRMRRHAEGLVILSGAAPSRQWRKPVQLMDVVRAAVAEVEDYERIEVRRLPRLGRRRPRRRRPHPPARRTPRERHGVLAPAHRGPGARRARWPTASPWRSTTAASA